MPWGALAQIAQSVTASQVDARSDALKAGNVCAYIYTSGTTGNPKAVMILICMYVFMYVCLCVYVCVYVCMCVCVCLCMYVCIYVCVCGVCVYYILMNIRTYVYIGDDQPRQHRLQLDLHPLPPRLPGNSQGHGGASAFLPASLACCRHDDVTL